MKKTFIFAVAVITLAFASSITMAASVGVMVLNVSGTAQFPGTNFTKGVQQVATTVTKTFKEADIYTLIVNAVSNAAITAIPTQTLPADGYIAYNPNFVTNMFTMTTYDHVYTNITGLFYVTNKSGFFYPLSGRDTNGNYYSFIELDTVDQVLGPQGFGFANGALFPQDFNSIFTENFNTTTSNSSETDTETPVLFIHDDPYISDDADEPGIFFFNDISYPSDYLFNFYHAIEIRGVLSLSFKGTSNKVTVAGTLNGTGNTVMKNGQNDNVYGIITSAKATLASP